MGSKGHEVPVLDNQILTVKNADTVFRAKRVRWMIRVG